MNRFTLRIAVSNSHVHLSREHALRVLGRDPTPDPTPTGHPTCGRSADIVTLVGPKGSLDRARVLTPCSKETWVELNRTDAFRLGVHPPLEAGELCDGGIVIRGSAGTVEVRRNVVIEVRHVEITPEQAKLWGLAEGQTLCADIMGPRALTLRNVKVRVVSGARPGFDGVLEIDRDEANAGFVKPGDFAELYADK